MPIECVWMGEFNELPPDPYVPGWMFFHGPWANSFHLSNHFKAFHDRAPICVILPVASRPGYGTGFCIDSCPTDRPDEHWEITISGMLVVGQKPSITVAPSIHCLGIYHGFMQDGVLTDDLGA